VGIPKVQSSKIKNYDGHLWLAHHRKMRSTFWHSQNRIIIVIPLGLLNIDYKTIVELWAKEMWSSVVLSRTHWEPVGNFVNIISNHLKLGENMLGTIWNIMGTPKIVENPPAPPSQGKKEPILWVHAGPPHWVPRISMSRIMAKAMNCGDIGWRNLAMLELHRAISEHGK